MVSGCPLPHSWLWGRVPSSAVVLVTSPNPGSFWDWPSDDWMQLYPLGYSHAAASSFPLNRASKVDVKKSSDVKIPVEEKRQIPDVGC